MLIYHLFADEGVESEALSAYGRVVRVGLDPRDTNESEPVAGDVTEVPLQPGADLVVAHPPCYKFTQRRDEDAPDLIPETRAICSRLGDEWIIENKPEAWSDKNRDRDADVVLHGGQFGLPIAHERGFETSYEVPSPPPRQVEVTQRVENTGPKPFWQSIKGYSGDYRGQVLRVNSCPRAYIDYLVRPLLD